MDERAEIELRWLEEMVDRLLAQVVGINERVKSDKELTVNLTNLAMDLAQEAKALRGKLTLKPEPVVEEAPQLPLEVKVEEAPEVIVPVEEHEVKEEHEPTED